MRFVTSWCLMFGLGVATVTLSGCGAGVPKACTEGEPGCACALGGCLQPGDGGAAACRANVCVACTPGSAGCPPVNARCVSPCTEDVTLADAGVATCSVDGLLDGCLGDRVCTAGSCVAPGARPPTCTTNLDCPDFQACLGGLCFSNCVVDGDCEAGQACERRVCRTTCSTNASSCPAGTACFTSDGQRGFCRDVDTTPPGGGQTRVNGTFTLSATSLSFSNAKLTGSLTITNHSDTAQEFIVRKVEHAEYTAGRTTLVTTNPLSWLAMAQSPAPPAPAQSLTVELDGHGASTTIVFGNAANENLPRWDGRIEVANLELGRQRVSLSYQSQPDGQWQGTMAYFSYFPDTGLDTWVKNKSNTAALQNVGNAFIQRWAAFRAGVMSLDEFKAVTTATTQETWRWPSVRLLCPDANTACYLYDNPQGHSLYSSSLTQYPIPTGVAELPITVNLQTDPSQSDGQTLKGRIVTGVSLHEPGEPGVALHLSTPPTACETKGGQVMCGVDLFDATVLVGGRYVTSAADTGCARAPKNAAGASTFSLTRTPWLVPGFTAGTDVDSSTGLRYRYECRDDLLPGGAAKAAVNHGAAGANPIPDARTRKRHLELLDGVLVNSEEFIVLFKESFPSFLDGTDTSGFSAYGFMTLRRAAADLDADAFTPGTVADARPAPSDVLGVSCGADVLKLATGSTTLPTTGPALDALAATLVTGVQQTSGPPTPIGPADPVKVHFFCEDTGLFDGGPHDDGSATPIRVACPGGSRVKYFTLGSASVAAPNQAQLAALPCQQGFVAGTTAGQIASRGTCQDTLNAWVANGLYAVALDPVWSCADTSQYYCSADRFDLRAGKNFYSASTPQAVALPLRTEVSNAFRYKTRFVNRQGTSVGFAPQICVPNSDQVPYCYEPDAIERVQARVDCAIALYTQRFSQLSAASQTALRDYLVTNFSYEEERDPTLPLPVIHEGFEWLNAELLVMMGDDSYTRAFTSRFDLAGQSVVSFDGPAFETNGISLSGGAGFELYTLYQSVQYYDQALNRFYALSPLLWKGIALLGPNNGFIGRDTVVTYFARLIRASSQKSRAWSEIAKRYQGFNKPDLARAVVQRAYTSAYLEAIVLSRIILELGSVVKPEDRAQLASEVESAALVYRSAFLAMRENYQAITDQPTVFGFAPDYVPFPALDPQDVDAFTKTLASAKSLLAVASAKEDLAINSSRSFDTDAASFQSQLVSVRNTYEDQLADMCGTFTGTDGQVHPAIPKYAYLNEKAKLLGNPCGLAGNGQLYAALADVDKAVNAFSGVRARHDDLVQSVAIEQERVETQCGLAKGTAEYQFTAAGKVSAMNAEIALSQAAITAANNYVNRIATMGTLSKCIAIVGTAGGTDCPAAAVAMSAYSGASTISAAITLTAQSFIAERQYEISSLNARTAQWVTERQCDYAKADSNAKVATMVLGFKEIDIEAYAAQLDISQKVGAVVALRNASTRLIAEQAQTEQLAINVEAARNDPNVRISKNDAILTADATFQAALREAYRATRVYEYYTSQSYAHLGDLFLVRLASRGDISLEAYLFALEQAFNSFEEQYGNPDERVMVLSLRDDVLHIPRIGDDGASLTEAQRLERFHQALADPRHLDPNGYLVFALSTGTTALSPLTRDHKVRSIQAEIVGSDVGDNVGRIYLRQKGTGVIAPLVGDTQYFAFPQRTAVLNPFFNGHRVFADSVYASDHLRDRPLLNTHWDLVLNQKDEHVNQDINLLGLADVRLYITYTDFTRL